MQKQSYAEKYRPKEFQDLVGQELPIQEVKVFLETWSASNRKKTLVLHGPAGTGKTTLAHIAAKEKNLEIFELNASDLRNKAKLEEILKPATLQRSLLKKGKLILMDEVDGVTGSDRGGIPELVRLMATTRFPIIMTCNDVWQTKLSPLRSKSKLVELKPLNLGQIISILYRTVEKEGLRKDPAFLKQIALKSQGDVRAALNDLQSYMTGESLFVDTQEKRDQEDSIFNILKRVFKERSDFLNIFDSTKLSLDEILLWLEENIPKEYKDEALAKAYFALGQADIFRGRIYKNQFWRFLVYQNIFQSSGISYAKSQDLPDTFTKYEPPKRILKIWLNNQKIAKKKTIAQKYARLVHCSTKRILSEFEVLRPIIKKPEVQAQLRLSDDEIAYLQK